MDYRVVSSTEFTYPDRLEYTSAREKIDVFSARGSFATWQMILSGLDSPKIDVSFSGLPEGVGPEIYSMRSVMVERNEGISSEEMKPHWPERVAPYRIYDCLRTFDGSVDVEGPDKIGGLYFALKIEADAMPGIYPFSLKLNDKEIDGNLEIYKARLPKESLKIIVGYRREPLEKFHHLTPGTPEYEKVDKQYLSLLRRMHQNMMYVFAPAEAEEIASNQWRFDFTPMVKYMEDCEKSGITYFNLPSVGRRQSWKGSTILLRGKIPAMSYEGYCYLTQYLPALKKVLDDHGWTDRCVMGIADEPNDINATEYRALCGLVHRIVPEIKLCDAMSYGNLHGALDIWVPLNAEYDQHRKEMESFRNNGSELWFYVCCVPRSNGYINRFLDYPLLSTRYLHWGNYKYNLTGFLHWASNTYQPGQDPFELNCPEHHNTDSVCFLPAGDTHLLYPGDGEPWMSIRLENERASAEEYELLKQLSVTDKALADEICDSVFHSFRDVEYDVELFTQTKRRLLSALST